MSVNCPSLLQEQGEMMMIVNSHYKNAVVGKLVYANDEGVIMVECNDLFESYSVPCHVSNADDAQILIDQIVCVHFGIVHALPHCIDNWETKK
jgi:hypothetical protein